MIINYDKYTDEYHDDEEDGEDKDDESLPATESATLRNKCDSGPESGAVYTYFIHVFVYTHLYVRISIYIPIQICTNTDEDHEEGEEDGKDKDDECLCLVALKNQDDCGIEDGVRVRMIKMRKIMTMMTRVSACHQVGPEKP